MDAMIPGVAVRHWAQTVEVNIVYTESSLSVGSVYRNSVEMRCKMVELAPGITADPAVRFGKAVIRGTRVPVDTVVARVASGMALEKVAEEYGITVDDVYHALHYAALRLAEEQIWATR
ncbi:MAG: DUF433 domain-containing protein [Roseiflexus sp.]|nr:DUF433 domain-containing protein [Roseiflexus sp.]